MRRNTTAKIVPPVPKNWIQIVRVKNNLFSITLNETPVQGSPVVMYTGDTLSIQLDNLNIEDFS